jgi:hypothetical protein
MHLGSINVSNMWITDVDFNLVQLIIAKRFSIKTKKYRMPHTHTHYTYIFTLKSQTGKTSNLFRAAPLILFIHHIFIVIQYNI